MNNVRREKIVEIITIKSISTQEELIKELAAAGYSATQATICRDLKALKVMKTIDSNGIYKYVLPKTASESHNENINVKFREAVLSVNYAMNQIVIKTVTGMASAIALMIDSDNNEFILGCVAGDDTIIIITKDVESAAIISSYYKDYLGDTN